MHSTILCDKRNVILKKTITEDEDEKYDVFFDCEYNEEVNLFQIIKNDQYYNLLYKLNTDLFNDFYQIKIGENNYTILYYLADKFDKENYVLNFDSSNNWINNNSIEIFGKQSNYSKIKPDYFKCEIFDTLTTIKLENNRLFYHFTVTITSDNLESDLKAILMKKKIYRLKKFIEKK